MEGNERMTMDANEVFGEDECDRQEAVQYFSAKQVWIQKVVLHLVLGVDETKYTRFAGIIDKGLEDARKRSKAKQIEREERKEREMLEHERIRLMLREQEEAEQEKRREAQKGRDRSRGLER